MALMIVAPFTLNRTSENGLRIYMNLARSPQDLINGDAYNRKFLSHTMFYKSSHLHFKIKFRIGNLSYPTYRYLIFLYCHLALKNSLL